MYFSVTHAQFILLNYFRCWFIAQKSTILSFARCDATYERNAFFFSSFWLREKKKIRVNARVFSILSVCFCSEWHLMRSSCCLVPTHSHHFGFPVEWPTLLSGDSNVRRMNAFIFVSLPFNIEIKTSKQLLSMWCSAFGRDSSAVDAVA